MIHEFNKIQALTYPHLPLMRCRYAVPTNSVNASTHHLYHIPYCTVLYRTVPYCTVLYRTLSCSGSPLDQSPLSYLRANPCSIPILTTYLQQKANPLSVFLRACFLVPPWRHGQDPHQSQGVQCTTSYLPFELNQADGQKAI